MKKNARVRMFAESSMFTRTRPTILEQKEYIKKEQYSLLETPCNCSCSICSYKNSRERIKDIRQMRNEEKKLVDNYFRFDYNDEDEMVPIV